ncbi:MAG: cytochrome c biogenesis protein CcsA [Phycisphaerae bacterium]|jgi:heme exporter protein C|nr:cytochrome c biogenesis protein CcsA [Phycisphaerae bacterium]
MPPAPTAQRPADHAVADEANLASPRVGPKLFGAWFWALNAVLFAAVLAMALWYAPIEKSMGLPQKIFYAHLPVAINTFVAAFIVFIASVGYLWQRQLWWDDLADAAGKVTALFCAIVLLTGMTWARSAWQVWWTWSPRLTFSLVLLLLYVVYPMVRGAIESPQRRAVVSAVYGVVAFLDVPLVYLSVKLMPDMHPSSITLEPAMKHTLLAWFAPVTLMMIGLVHTNFRLNTALRLRNAVDAPARSPRTGPSTGRSRSEVASGVGGGGSGSSGGVA